MAFTQTELDALKKAYASGTTRVTYDGRTVEYGSADDLWKRIQNIEAEIAQVAGTARKSAGFVSFNRGDR
jgi:hypothetical protein